MLLFVLWQCPGLWVEGSIPSRFEAPLAQLVRATVNRIAGRLPDNPEAHSFPKKCTNKTSVTRPAYAKGIGDRRFGKYQRVNAPLQAANDLNRSCITAPVPSTVPCNGNPPPYVLNAT